MKVHRPKGFGRVTAEVTDYAKHVVVERETVGENVRLTWNYKTVRGERWPLSCKSARLSARQPP